MGFARTAFFFGVGQIELVAFQHPAMFFDVDLRHACQCSFARRRFVHLFAIPKRTEWSICASTLDIANWNWMLRDLSQNSGCALFHPTSIYIFLMPRELL